MGTRFEVAIATDGFTWNDVGTLGELALRDIEEWHQRLTRFEPDSWLSHANRTAADQPVRLDEDTFQLFSDALAVWRDSGGAFDVTKGDGDALALDRDLRTLRFARGGVALDLGAIGKGHALDSAATLLRRHGVTSAFLQGGTSSGVAIGRAPDARSWTVAVAAGEAGAAADVIDHIDLIDAAFALSDEGSQPEAPAGRHIVDPRAVVEAVTERAPRRVLVTGPSARLADAWSTALCVIGEVPASFPMSYSARFLRK